jgi:pimeloyl-ACP methyl ester carboxylesterase
MDTCYAVSQDGTRIAYDVSGSGPALILLHGAGRNRKDWANAGYVDRLSASYRVISIDMRGIGESALRTDETDYTIDNLCADVFSVADACGVDQFYLWGFSFGGNIARHIATMTDRVLGLIVMGSPLGHYTNERLDQNMNSYITRWKPDVAAFRAGTLPAPDMQSLVKSGVLVWNAIFLAMKRWPVKGVGDLKCPALMIVGSLDDNPLEWVRQREQIFNGSRVHLHVLEGLTHEQEFSEIDTVLPLAEEFLASMQAE